MLLLGWLRRKRPRLEPDVQKPKKDLAALIEELRALQWHANCEGSLTGSVSPRISMALKEAEQAVIAALEDPLQREIFRILARYKFDLLRFLGKEDWEAVLRKGFREIADFLGEPYPEGGGRSYVLKDYPFIGEELYLWLLQRAKGTDPEKRLVPVFASLEESQICGCSLNFQAKQCLAGRFLVVFLGEFARQSEVFLGIVCDTVDGEEFIKERLLDRV